MCIELANHWCLARFMLWLLLPCLLSAKLVCISYIMLFQFRILLGTSNVPLSTNTNRVVLITSGRNSIQRLGKQPFTKANSILNCFTGQYIIGFSLAFHQPVFTEICFQNFESFSYLTYEDNRFKQLWHPGLRTNLTRCINEATERQYFRER